MAQVTLRHDTVLSDVHLLQPNGSHQMSRLNAVGQPVFIAKFKILRDAERHDNSVPEKGDTDNRTEKGDTETKAVGGQVQDVGPALDEDGDLDIVRRPEKQCPESVRLTVHPIILRQCSPLLKPEEENEDDGDNTCFKDTLRIEHTMATPLEDVGKQVWRGAFLLADFILSQPVMFRGATVLELGAGMGLASIMMATKAKKVYCTDVGEDLLKMCQRNVVLNNHLLEPGGGEVRVRQLDWQQQDLCTDADVEFSWTEEEVADIFDNINFIIAADVFYDDDLTDAFFRTLCRLYSYLPHGCVTYISTEKRMNFTVQHLDVSCEAYDHFRCCLSRLSHLVDGQISFSVEQLPSTFPQFLHYERIEQLELWKLTTTHPPFDQAHT
ncbi:methyltransferase-like protein 22 [Genypterus blacodes]|uniref:methyltransferase-like protein 22 n=1 Tax=Genypterus blacodes TaxID=154954 RepID=UPI003F7674AA